MRVVGYVREMPGPETGDTAFMQSERIRRWVARNGYQLVSICQDARSSESDRDGFGALLGILAAGQADIVLVPTLEAFSADKVAQEVVLFELRARSVAVASTEEEDLDALAQPTVDPARLFIRDTLAKSFDFTQAYQRTLSAPAEVAEPDVIIEFVEPTRSMAPVSDISRDKATA